MSAKDDFLQLLVDRGSCPEAVAWAKAHPGDITGLNEYTNAEWGMILVGVGLRVGAVSNDAALALMDTVVKITQPLLPSSQVVDAVRTIGLARGTEGYNPRIRAAMGVTYAALKGAPATQTRVLAEIKKVITPELIMGALNVPVDVEVASAPKKARRKPAA